MMALNKSDRVVDVFGVHGMQASNSYRIVGVKVFPQNWMKP